MGHDGRVHAQRGAAATSAKLPDTDVSAPRYPRVTSFRSRRSALSSAQQQTWERLWPVYGLDAPHSGGHQTPAVDASPVDSAAWFGREAPVVLEIGCGTGTSTLAMAHAEPDVDVIAVDVYRRGLAQLLCAVARAGVDNIRLIRGDAVDVLEHLIAPGSLAGVRVFFPDPWPKARHQKRRLLQPATFALIADRLRRDGVLHVATDHAGYAEHIAEAGDGEPRLARVDPRSRRLAISVDRPTTKYETKARHEGSAVTELLWERR
ncbi:MAG TPA: tRNA (guanosine(46)-N7)-methyltransferase TrmB [Mycobacterium sp.]|uniref:tRNA (guanosine(46)-N7)-methyltransferase TrmB n=1 Tax=Mycobacterium sp. TaxID=1785 RepID=UPI002D2D6C3D|nr:tRNA (guanosine(46)-N7)-methyltransferase TrmB [Mycobacterium sp.]HZU46482.1 tRNA (guanosine(46)-N7)-methyltransferase TrmB [Mycobacterium sp.]